MERWLRCVFAYALLTLFLPANPARAQLNVEPLAESVKGPGFGGAAKSTLSLFRGNADILEVRGEAALRFATPHPDNDDNEEFLFRDRILVHSSAGFKDVNRERVVDSGYGHLRYTRMQWLRFGAEIYGQAQYDQIRLLSRRLVAGAGIRAVLLDFDAFSAWLGSGYMHERERRNIPTEDRPPLGPDPTLDVNHRFSNYFTCALDLFEDRLSLVNVVYVQPRFDDFRDIQLLEQLSLAFKLSEYLSFTSDLTLRHDSRAPRSVKRTDLQLSQGFAVSF